jgi:predicted ATPase
VVMHLRSVSLRSTGADDDGSYPFSVPAVAAVADAPLDFRSEATFFVGENGSGKSTLLEGLACAARSIVIGRAGTGTDPTLAAGRRLGRALRHSWHRPTHCGFFLRAEGVFGYARRMDHLRDDLTREAVTIDAAPTTSPSARALGAGALRGQVGEIRRRYGAGVDVRSHGERFLTLFQQRLVPGGLYLIDEPEAPLSPTCQLSLLSLLKTMVAEQEIQFNVATHSPILMAFPGATILSFDGGQIRDVPYAELEHVTVTKQFLRDPDAFLRHM